MKVLPETTVAELMRRFPGGFSVGPGTPDDPGALSRILAASSHLHAILDRFRCATGNQGYMVVDMDEEMPHERTD